MWPPWRRMESGHFKPMGEEAQANVPNGRKRRRPAPAEGGWNPLQGDPGAGGRLTAVAPMMQFD